AGDADRPRFTTGPATRHALAAAGALGASTGSVVHLPLAPTTAAARPPIGAPAAPSTGAARPTIGAPAALVAHRRAAPSTAAARPTIGAPAAAAAASGPGGA